MRRGILGFSLMLFVAGCGSTVPTSLSGSVTLNGKALQKGTLSLTPESGGGGTAGAAIVDGKYSISDLKPGRYHVLISADPAGPVIMPNSPEAKRTMTPAEIRRMSDALPADVKGNQETIEVVSGAQTKDFTLTSTVKN
jgi:hypothetical protein